MGNHPRRLALFAATGVAAVATAWVLINMTLTIFSWVELVGHLPLYGAMAVLLVWTPREDDERLWVDGVLKRVR